MFLAFGSERQKSTPGITEALRMTNRAKQTENAWTNISPSPWVFLPSTWIPHPLSPWAYYSVTPRLAEGFPVQLGVTNTFGTTKGSGWRKRSEWKIVMTTKRVAGQNGNNGQKAETTKKPQKRAGSFPNLYYHQYSRFDYVLRQASSVLAGFAIIRQITFKVDIIPHFIFL